MKSATDGMSLGQRIAHVGGRTTQDHRVEFGSVFAVSLFFDHVVRDLLANIPCNDADTIRKRIEVLERRHKGLRPLARDRGLDASYLFRLKNSERMNPSDEVLSALGLERVTYYRLKDGDDE